MKNEIINQSNYEYIHNMYDTFDKLFDIQIGNGEIMQIIKNYEDKTFYTREIDRIIDGYTGITFLVPYEVHKLSSNESVIKYILQTQ